MIPRRQLLHLVAIGYFCAWTATALAQSYPSRPVQVIVGFPAGGPNDILARLMADWLSARLGQPVTVENKPGASSNTATELVVRAPADGYTLLLVGPANAINASLIDKPDFNFLRDIAPVVAVIREPLVMVVHPSVPANSVAQFIALAKAKPGKIKMAATGKGSSPHMSGLLFTTMTGVDLKIVQFSGGGPALKQMADGEMDMMFEPMSASIEPIRAGKLRALAVTTVTRSPALPDVPSLSDSVPGYEASVVTGIGVPAKTPAEVIERLNTEINAALADPATLTRLIDAGGMVLGGSPAEFGRLLTEETKKWGNVIKASGIRP